MGVSSSSVVGGGETERLRETERDLRGWRWPTLWAKDDRTSHFGQPA